MTFGIQTCLTTFLLAITLVLFTGIRAECLSNPARS